MIRIEHSLVIARPPAEVFTYLADPANLPEWQASAVSTKAHGPVEKGALFSEVREVLGKRVENTAEIVEYEPGRRFAIRNLSGPVRFRVDHRLEPANSGTRLTVVVEGEPGGFARLAAGLVAAKVRRELESDFGRLKKLLEARA